MDDESPDASLREAIPVFLVDDIASTMRWYETNLGFGGRAAPPSPPHTFAILSRDRVTIFLQQLDGYRRPDLYDERAGGVWSVYLQTNGVRPLFEKLSRLPGVTILETLTHQDYGQTEFVIRDPNGYALVFAQAD